MLPSVEFHDHTAVVQPLLPPSALLGNGATASATHTHSNNNSSSSRSRNNKVISRAVDPMLLRDDYSDVDESTERQTAHKLVMAHERHSRGRQRGLSLCLPSPAAAPAAAAAGGGSGGDASRSPGAPALESYEFCKDGRRDRAWGFTVSYKK